MVDTFHPAKEIEYKMVLIKNDHIARNGAKLKREITPSPPPTPTPSKKQQRNETMSKKSERIANWPSLTHFIFIVRKKKRKKISNDDITQQLFRNATKSGSMF